MKTFCVISHTHWDREWYMPLESFKLRLVDLIDRLLIILEENPKYIFHLDAQTIVLEDYLAFRPGKRDILKKYISENRLIIGPWYLQNDFYLTSGEATIRNLIEGHKIAAEFGACSKVGYAPDQFGNISQLPQILDGFGIDNFIFGRGLKRELPDGSPCPTEFIWEGADGTKSLAIHMRYWYNNAQHFPPETADSVEMIDNMEKAFEGIAITPYILMMNGVDHLEAQPDLLPILENVNAAYAGAKVIKQYIMQEYVDAVKAYIKENGTELVIKKNELRSGHDGEILQGTLSSRSHLKIANVKAQTMLENKLEPIYSMLELSGASGAYSLDHFRYMWKELMKNHPHDSICGCSRDEVHHHMEDNYERLETTTEDMLDRGLKCAAIHLDTKTADFDEYIIAVANTTQTAQTGVCKVVVDIRTVEDYKGIEIVDADGNPADFEVFNKTTAVRDGFSPLNLPGNFEVHRYEINLIAEVEPFAIRGYAVRRAAATNTIEKCVENDSKTLENEFLKATVSESGAVDLLCKATGKVYKNVLDIEESCDRGDSYMRFASNDPFIYGRDFPADIKVCENNKYVKSISITKDIVSPAYYDFNKFCRSSETVVSKVTTELVLKAGSDKLEILFTVDNKASDHRLRLLIDTDIKSSVAIADIPFDIVGHTDGDHHPDTYSKVLPNSTFALLENSGEGFAVFTEGTHEFEHLDDLKTLAFTMVRATGVISRNMETGKPVGGEQWACPANQCHHTISGRIGLMPYAGSYIEVNVPVKSVQFRTGLLAYYTSCDERRFMQGRSAVQATDLGGFYYLPDPYKDVKIPDNKSFINVEGRGTLVTALKKAEAEDAIVLRTVNLSENETTLNVKASGDIILTKMDEVSEKSIGKNAASTPMPPKKIVTVKIK